MFGVRASKVKIYDSLYEKKKQKLKVVFLNVFFTLDWGRNVEVQVLYHLTLNDISLEYLHEVVWP